MRIALIVFSVNPAGRRLGLATNLLERLRYGKMLLGFVEKLLLDRHII